MPRHVVLAVWSLLVACAGFQTYRLTSLDFPNKSGRLGNGLRVVIQPDDTQPTAVVTVRYDVGAASDPKDKKGLAHLVEHLAFRMGDEIVTTPVEVAAPGAGAASTTGETAAETRKAVKERVLTYIVGENAYTTVDETVYYKDVVPRHIDDVLADFAAQMADFSPAISEEVFTTERDVVRNELRSRYESTPLGSWYLDVFERLYPKDHPYQGRRAIGSHETIGAITLADVSAFLKAHYHPNNATLTIVGPVEPDATLQLVMKHFGTKAKRELTPVARPEWQPRYREETVIVPKAKNTMLTVVWPLDKRDSEEALALTGLDDAAWFGYRLVYNRGWSYWVQSWVDESALESRFVVNTLLRDHDDVDEVRDKIFEIAGLLDGAIDPKSFKNTRRRQSYYAMLGIEDRQERSEQLAYFFSTRGQPIGWASIFEAYEKLELERVRDIGSKILRKERALVLVHTPVAPEQAKQDHAATAAASVTAADVKKASDVGHEERSTLLERYRFTQPQEEYTAWALAAAEKQSTATAFTLDNGLRVRIRQEGTLPILAASVTFLGGEIAEAPGKAGTGHLMLQSMGIWGRALWEKRAAMGITGREGSDGESLVTTERVASFYADPLLMTIAERLSDPVFMREDVVKARDSWLRDLEDSDEYVAGLASFAYWKARGFARLDPFPNKQSVASIDRGDVLELYEKLIYPENAVLSVVSDRPVDEIRALVERHFGDWDATGRRPFDVRTYISNLDVAPSAQLALVPVEGTSQSRILIAFDAPGWADVRQKLLADAVAEVLHKRVKRLREAYGVTYGVSAVHGAYAQLGNLRVESNVERAATSDALRTLWRAVDEARAMKLDQGDLERVKRILMDRYTSLGESSSNKAETTGERVAFGHPDSYAVDAVRYLDQLTLLELQQAVDRLLGQTPVVVVAGELPDLGKVPALAGVKTVRYDPKDLL